MTGADEPGVFQSLVSAHAPRGSAIQLMTAQPGLVHATLLLCEEVEAMLGRRPLGALIHGGGPTAFSFEGLPFPNAAIGSGHLEMAWNIRGVMLSPLFDQDRADRSRRLFLDLIGQLATAAGLGELGRRCFAAATADTRSFLGLEGLMDIDMLEPDETYVGAWTFGLAHEFGHALDESSPWSAWIDEETLVDWTARGVEDLRLEDAEDGARLAAVLAGPGGAVLEPGHLRHEAAADSFSIYAQFGTVSRLVAALDLPLPSLVRMIGNCLVMLDCCYFIERCAGVVGLAAGSNLRGLDTVNALGWYLRNRSAVYFITYVLPALLADKCPVWVAGSHETSFTGSAGSASLAIFGRREQMLEGFAGALADVQRMVTAA